MRTGALRWTFHTIPRPGEPGYDTWPKDAWKDAGAANNWAGMTLDSKRGIVYVPTGSAVFDFYGGDRVGNDLYADTLLALDAETGKLIWHFQGVHHDLWDRDFPSPPALLTVIRDGKPVDAIAQTTKSGYVFLLDRTNGKPLFPIKESPYPRSTVPGEVTSPTQPLPAMPAPFAHQNVTVDTLTNRTPEAHAWAVKQLSAFISGGQFIPPTLDKLTVEMPGMDGGGEWGGPAVDPKTGVFYVNGNDTAWLVGLTAPPPAGSLGERTYQKQCAICHGQHWAGSPPSIPALCGIDGILTDAEIAATIRQGRGRMPPFSNLGDDEIQSVIQYLTRYPQQRENRAASGEISPSCDEGRVTKQENSPAATASKPAPSQAGSASRSSRKRSKRHALRDHRISPLPGSRRLSRNRPAMGHSERDRYEYRQIPVEDSIRRVSGVGSQGYGRYWVR